VTEKRATGPLVKPELKPADPLARLADHLGRLLGHADELLAEWRAHADGVRGQLDAQARGAAQAFQHTVEEALADTGAAAAAELGRAFGASAAELRADLERARQAAADLEAHMQRLAGGAKPSSVDELRATLAALGQKLEALRRRRGAPWAVLLGVSANLLLGAVLALVWTRTPTPTAPAPVPVVIAVAPDAPPPVVSAPPPPASPCADLAGDSAAKLVAECVARLCPGPRVDALKPGAYVRSLAACKVDDAAGRDLLAALQALERDKLLERLTCAPERDATGRARVTVRWLLDCPQAK
jgi:hypothetical protein